VGTTHAVLNELHTWQQDVLNDYIQLKKLQIFPIEEAGYAKAALLFPERALSLQDQSLLLIAHKLNATILTSDAVIRKTSIKHNIPVQGLIWILNQLHNASLLPMESSLLQLEHLKLNPFYRNNIEMHNELRILLKKLEH
jgi:predicted nucleic acid-binding protein